MYTICCGRVITLIISHCSCLSIPDKWTSPSSRRRCCRAAPLTTPLPPRCQRGLVQVICIRACTGSRPPPEEEQKKQKKARHIAFTGHDLENGLSSDPKLNDSSAILVPFAILDRRSKCDFHNLGAVQTLVSVSCFCAWCTKTNNTGTQRANNCRRNHTRLRNQDQGDYETA